MDARTAEQDFGRLGHIVGRARAAERLDAPQFAWEFLRRNRAYAADYARVRRQPDRVLEERWGLRFPVDPGLPAEEAEVFWRSSVAPAVVVPVAPAPPGDARAIALPAPCGAVRVADDGLHMRLPAGLQLLVHGAVDLARPVVVLLALDADFRLRLTAVEALHRLAQDGLAPPPRLSTQQRARLKRALIALDAAEGKASYREVAQRIFGPDDAERDDWRTSSARAATIRLVHLGRRLMNGGYLNLLRGLT